ncbi:hypothetical protein WMY93_030549 [Mugilogobius chulae]|uniref:Uncharacterized protein n=1 Tax=Mugilogobius chulae TaxID=88201 RepID=A0AAW0MFC4_9GOBI
MNKVYTWGPEFGATPLTTLRAERHHHQLCVCEETHQVFQAKQDRARSGLGWETFVFSYAIFLSVRVLAKDPTDVQDHAADRGHGRRKPQQFCGAQRHHHQPAQPAPLWERREYYATIPENTARDQKILNTARDQKILVRKTFRPALDLV